MACQATLALRVLLARTRAAPSACRASLAPSHRAVARVRVSLAALERRARRTPRRASRVPSERTRTTTTHASNVPTARSRPQREPHRASNAARSCLNHAALDRRKECRVACVRLERMVHRPPVDASTVLRYAREQRASLVIVIIVIILFTLLSHALISHADLSSGTGNNNDELWTMLMHPMRQWPMPLPTRTVPQHRWAVRELSSRNDLEQLECIIVVVVVVV